MYRYIIVLFFINMSYAMKFNHFKYGCKSEVEKIKKKNCSVVEIKGKKLKVVLSRKPTTLKCSKSDPLIGIVTEKKCFNLKSSDNSKFVAGEDGINDILNNRKFSVTDPSRAH